jgi:hypothetical protein
MTNKLKKLLDRTAPFVAGGLINLPVGRLEGAEDPNGILPALAERIAQLLTLLAYPLAFIGIIYSVYLLIVNSSNPEALKTTKKNIGYIAAGIFIIVFSIIIFNYISALFNGATRA